MRVLVGISGGVDSAVTALLLKQKGYEPVAVHLLLADNAENENARKCAEFLGIEYHCEDMTSEFSARVKKPFAEIYLKGQTPNPCVICNKEIKFGLMAELMEKYNCEKLATGHYVRSEFDINVCRWVLKKGVDTKKDQSYFLWSLTQEQLSNTIFPLGELTKEQVREIAVNANIPVASNPESQDVCFITDGDCGAFIADFTGEKSISGDFVDVYGKVLGKHKGIAHYTVGQRKGLGISSDAPLYVINKDAYTNTVILGRNEQLFANTIKLRDLNFISLCETETEVQVDAKIRYSTNSANAMLIVNGAEGMLKFTDPQRAPAPGQSAVFYIGDTVAGGGIII